jgi:acyl-CoA reductase-like NAD-dependent aldehyde dehydrogenase
MTSLAAGLTLRSPATGEVMGSAPVTSPEQVDAAVDAATAAFRSSWSRDATSRAAALSAWADAIEADAPALVPLLVTETGKLRAEAEFEVRSSVDALRYNAGMARYVGGRAGQLSGGTTAHLERQPVGVTAFIAPWNWPVLLLLRDLAPGLAAGVTAVVKPAVLTPFSTQRIVELAKRAGLPQGVVNLVHGDVPVGSRLVEHPAVRAVSFTGSTAAGKEIMRSAAATLKRTLLELGGKGCSLVFADADVEAAADNFVRTAFVGAGQVCMATTRILAEDAVFDDVLDAVVARASAMTVGDPFDPRSDMGPLISRDHQHRVMAYVELARSTARVVTGGHTVEDDPRGAYVAPTVVTDVDPGSALVQEEIFGPVVTVERFQDERDGIELANAVPFGLAAGVWTRDVGRAWRVARAVDAGSVWVNGYMSSYAEMPSGGFKQSGVGRTRGVEGIEQFTELKHINWS